MYSEAGWGGYPDAQDFMGALVQQIAGFAYTPDLGPVGSQSSYYPRDTSADAGALNFLGFFPAQFLATHIGTTGSQAGDMSRQAGAWDPAFQAATRDFQEAFGGLTVDGWIGPKTRSALKQAVDALNGRQSPIAPPQVIPPVTPPGVSPNPVQPPPGAQPASASGGMSTTTMALLGLGAVGAAYAAYKYLF